MRTLWTLACFMLSLCVWGLAVSQDLPPEIQADQFLLEGQRVVADATA